MKTRQTHEIVLGKKPAANGPAHRKRARARAVDLAVSQGRRAQDVSKSDWEQAKQELLNERDVEPIAGGHEKTAERERWDPVGGSTGYKVRVPSGDEEDAEGRSDVERLVEGGVRHAGRDQMREASREAEENE